MMMQPKAIFLSALLATTALIIPGSTWASESTTQPPQEQVSPEKYGKRIDAFIEALTKLRWNRDAAGIKRSIKKSASLALAYNQLRTLPPEIGKLVQLTKLDLNHNLLRTLPPEIGNLVQLEELDLNFNQLRTLPPEIVNNLVQLRTLLLVENQLQTLPSGIGNLVRLTTLYLGYNQLQTLPPEIGNLVNLTGLDLDNNQLQTFPPEIGKLVNLTGLYLDNNQLQTLPPEISNLVQLTDLKLRGNNLVSIPREIGQLQNLTLLDLTNNPILPRGENENMWGREELVRQFGNRVVLDDPRRQPPMNPNTTIEKVYGPLDAQPLRINRDVLKQAHVPEIPGDTVEDGQEFLEQFFTLLSQLNFGHEDREGYLSFNLLAGDFASDARGDQGLSNADKIFKSIIPRLTGYFKTLYGLPLEPGEPTGWQMYDEQKPALKKALSYILTTLQKTEDPGLRSALFLQLVDGLLHCPTGQKEGIDTVVLGLLEGTTATSSDLRVIVGNIMGLRKNAFFKMAILEKGAGSTQNVHLISTYEGRLKDELGLSNVLGYKEKMGILGADPFSNNPNNVLQVFYQLVTPRRLASWFMEKVQTSADIALRQKLETLSAKRVRDEGGSPKSALQGQLGGLKAKLDGLKVRLADPATSEEQKQTLQSQIQQLKGMLAKQAPQAQPQTMPEEKEALRADIQKLKGEVGANKLFHPITMLILIDYMRGQMGVDATAEDWWVGFFTADPVENQTATLTPEGAMRILIHMGYVIKS